MFYLYSDITLTGELSAEEMAKRVATALRIPAFERDRSGRYDDDEVFVSCCFGLEFELAKDDPPASTFHLSVNSETGDVEYDGSEREVDGSHYLLWLLQRGGLHARIRDDALLYG